MTRWVALAAVLASMAWTTAATAMAQTPAGSESISGGQVELPPEGFFDIVFAGGWVGTLIMLFLLALSITAAYLVIDHLLTIRRKEIMPEGLSDHVRELLAAGHLVEADQACLYGPDQSAFRNYSQEKTLRLGSGRSEPRARWVRSPGRTPFALRAYLSDRDSGRPQYRLDLFTKLLCTYR